MAGGGGIDSNEFWVQPLPAGTPRRVGSFKAFTADWTPDGSHIIYSYQHKIAIVNEDGSDPHTIAEVPGSAAWFRYSPDGRLIRFSILQDSENSSSLWEMRADGTNLHQLLPNWKESLDQCCGRWSPDGNYYYFLTSAFLAGGGPSQGIWVMPEHRSIFRRDIAPARLTTGPLRFGAPTPSTDGKSLFAVGDELRVELFSYDPHAQRFDSYLGGLSAGPVAFSPDGKWVAYVSYPEMTLWKSRTDLSEKMQLTFPPVRVYGPQWSPDGSQIAFGDVQFHRPPKVYLVSASGGDSPKQIAPSNIGDVDTDPTWTPDGKSIIFARAPAGERGGQADLPGRPQQRKSHADSRFQQPLFTQDFSRRAVYRGVDCGRETVDASGPDHQLLVNVGGRRPLRLQPVVARREIRLRAGKRGRVRKDCSRQDQGSGFGRYPEPEELPSAG